jgi:subtilisin family serine protease
MLADEPIYRLPPDWEIKEVTTPLAEQHDWTRTILGLPEIWVKHRGAGLKVASLDTGCDVKHPDLKGAITAIKDFTGSRYKYEDRNGHGTWVAGQKCARANDIGIRGPLSEAELIVAKVLGDNGSGSDSGIAKGMDWCFDQGADIFSLSLGGGEMSETLHRLFAQIAAAGKFIFCAAGNDGGPVNYPAAWIECISVGACDQNGKLTKWTSSKGRLDIVAPGVEMLSTIPGGRYGTMSGTSMACPLAASIGGLALAKHRAEGGKSDLVTVEDMRKHLKKISNPKGIIDGEKFRKDLTSPPVTPPPDNPPPSQEPILEVRGVKIFAPARAGDAISIEF